MPSKGPVMFVLAGMVVLAMSRPAAQTPPQLVRESVRFYPDDPLWRDDDMRTIPPPAEHDLSKSHEFIANTFGETARSFGPALNVNTLGEVPDSSWFTNRIGRHDMTLEEVLRGPDRVDGPAAGVWQVTGRPDVGITPKFTIRDARGDRYLIKLDPPSNPELPSSVELISTKLFHAIGYNVPEDFIVTFDVNRLRVAPGARARNASGDHVPIDQSDVDRWLRNVPRQADGSIRALASRYVPGKVIGQFKYTGRRADDPNDIFPHERRRELRGMRVFAAWLNHDDARSINTIDSYIDEGGRRYIRHYMQDFGSNLGSGSTSAQQPRGGYEYLVEPGKVAKGLALFGFYQRNWMSIRWPKYPSVGNIEADVFDPATWKTEYPNPAFNQMDAADAFWAASIVSRFTDRMIRAVVEQARLSDRAAAAYLADVIIKRRDKTVRWGVTSTNPVDRLEVRSRPAPVLVFDNIALRLGIVPRDVRYTVRWAPFDNRTGATEATQAQVETSVTRVSIPPGIWGPPDAAGIRYAVASISTNYPPFEHWANPVVVTIRNRDGRLDVVGIDHRLHVRRSRAKASHSRGPRRSPPRSLSGIRR
jgi:hypothetical protein